MTVRALEQAWTAWGDLGAGLSEQEWNTPTRLDGWCVRHVYAHYSPTPGLVGTALHSPQAEGPVTVSDASELLKLMQAPGGVAHTEAERIEREGTRVGDEEPTSSLVEQFQSTAPEILQSLRETDLSRRVDYGGLAVVTADEALRIFVMEAVVHYFDMATALALPTPGPMAGEPMEVTTRLLIQLVDPVTLIDVATGRANTQLFPVLR